MNRILIIFAGLVIYLPFNASASDIFFERYYIKKYACQRDNNDYDDCIEHTRKGGLWSHNSIGIVRKGRRVCGIAHYSGGKTDVTRFVGTMEGNRARVRYSSSHDSQKIAEAFIVLTPQFAKWEPIGGQESGAGYFSAPSNMPRAAKPGARESYVVDAKHECQEFLLSGKEFPRLAWEF